MITETQTYHKDVILSAEQDHPNWWRLEGHKLYWLDIEPMIKQVNPEIVIIGQGKLGMMAIMPEVNQELEKRNIRMIADKTPNAVTSYNQYISKIRLIGAFHLTC